MKRRVSAVFAGLLLVGMWPGVAAAAPVLDQQNLTTGTQYNMDGWIAQTFTVGITGDLVGVDLIIGCAPSVSLMLSVKNQNRNNGQPGSTTIASTFAAIGSESWHHFTFSDPAHVLAGARLSLALNPAAGCWTYLGEGYSTGNAWVQTGPNTWTSLGKDMPFKTYVEPAIATPAPTAPPTVAATPPTAATPTASPAPGETAGGSPTPITSAIPTDQASPSSAVTAAPTADPGSGDSGGVPTPLIIVGVLLLVVAVAGVSFFAGRRSNKKG
jgi:hypothetical protein